MSFLFFIKIKIKSVIMYYSNPLRKMFKRIIFLTLIISLIFASIIAIVYFLSVNKFPINEEKKYFVFEEIAKEGVNFSKREDVYFNWAVNEEEKFIYIKGEKVILENHDEYSERSIVDFLEKKGFQKDPLNFIDNKEIKATGYRKENIVCIIDVRKENEEILEIGLLCGEIN